MLDYLIVGQGIAGTMLAYFLDQLHKKILIIDDFSAESSTQIAIGTCNPVTGNNFVKTWLADEIFPFARMFYAELEREFGMRFYYPKPLYRIFPDEKRKSKWLKKCELPAFQQYVAQADDNYFSQWLQNPLRGIEILQAGYIDTLVLLTCFRQRFLQKQQLIDARFKFSDLQMTGEFVQWQDRRAARIIFCEGAAALANPLFGDLPFSVNKGQFLTLTIKHFPVNHIIKKKCIILPFGDGIFKVGATYESHYDDLSPDQTGREQRQSQIADTVRMPFSIVAQKAGLRPASIDRKPLIGMHHREKRAGIFNGFGAKGLTLAPWFARHFVQHLAEGSPLLTEVAIANYLQRTVRNRA